MIKPYVSSREDYGELLESFRSAWTIFIIDNVGVVPLFELQNLFHLGKDTDAPLLRGRKHRFTRDIG